MKRDIPITYVKQTPLDFLLDLWVQFQRRPDINLGFKRKDSILKSEAAADFEQLVDRSDELVADGVEACIASLKAHHSWAIKRRCGIASVWRFAQLDFEQTLKEAEQELEIKLRKNSVTANYF